MLVAVSWRFIRLGEQNQSGHPSPAVPAARTGVFLLGLIFWP